MSHGVGSKRGEGEHDNKQRCWRARERDDNGRIFRIRSTNMVTQLVLEVIMTHLNLEGSRRYIVRG